MKLNFGGVVPLSTIDWPGKASMSVFFGGCNLNCKYCQNHNIIDKENFIDISELSERIEESSDFIDAILITGGEPFLQKEALTLLAKKAKSLGLEVGIQTNGCFPDRLLELIELCCCDFVSLDIKAPFSDSKKYSDVAGVEVDVDKIKKSLNILKKFTSSNSKLKENKENKRDMGKKTKKDINKNIEDKLNLNKKTNSLNKELQSEVTTTLFPGKIGMKDVESITSNLEGLNYVLQQGKTENARKKEYRNIDEFDAEEMREIGKNVGYENISIRTKEGGKEKL